MLTRPGQWFTVTLAVTVQITLIRFEDRFGDSRGPAEISLQCPECERANVDSALAHGRFAVVMDFEPLQVLLQQEPEAARVVCITERFHRLRLSSCHWEELRSHRPLRRAPVAQKRAIGRRKNCQWIGVIHRQLEAAEDAALRTTGAYVFLGRM